MDEEVEKEWFEIIEFKNNQLPAVNGENITKIQKNINTGFNAFLNLLYPIGKIEIFFDGEDHSEYMGFTWEKVGIGKMIVGTGTGTDKNNISKTFNAGDNAGEYEHKQTADELVEHIHKDITVDGTKFKIANHGIIAGSDLTVLASNGASNTIKTGNIEKTSTTQQAMNVTNPTYGVYIWQRIE